MGRQRPCPTGAEPPFIPNPHHRITEKSANLKPENKSLIHALHNLLADLELTVTPGCDEEAFTELKHIVHRRIESLERDGPIAPATPPQQITGTE